MAGDNNPFYHDIAVHTSLFPDLCPFTVFRNRGGYNASEQFVEEVIVLFRERLDLES